MRQPNVIIGLSFRSLLNRKLTVLLTVFSIAVSVMLILSVEKVRQDAKLSFANTISGTDLIVGARSGSVQLLLYSVFRIGNATNNISWKSYRSLISRNDVKWTIPISLGDSHRGFRVMGTNKGYFQYYRYGQNRELNFNQGKPFDDVFDTVLGAEVAATLGYNLNEQIVIDHGIGRDSFTSHKDKPFRIVGILKRTGTPVDRTVHVSLGGITAIHVDWEKGKRVPGMVIDAEMVRKMDLTPRSITAVLIGLKSRLSAFKALRDINNFRGEPLLAILPGVALQELWGLMGTAEVALSVVSILVVVGALFGMLTMLLANLNVRRREMAILRSIGAQPLHVATMFVVEAIFIAGVSCLIGLIMFYIGMLIFQPIIEEQFGLFMPISYPSLSECFLLLSVMAGAAIAGLVPAIMAYRRSVADGMTIRN
ncbi:MAG: ABC transporter permease [Pseudomonadota bacterium]|nr:ABC transporter permease [Pseudomonadota bacterium]